MQIARRLRAMIVNLADTLPAQRHPALHQELNLLDRMIGKLYATLTGFEPEWMMPVRSKDSRIRCEFFYRAGDLAVLSLQWI
jgi:hypothetical protein